MPSKWEQLRNTLHFFAIVSVTCIFALGTPVIAQDTNSQKPEDIAATGALNSEGETGGDTEPALESTPDPVLLVANQDAGRMTSEFDKDSLRWIGSETEKFPALWEPDTSGNPYGAVLFVHGEGQTPDWPHTVNRLRLHLPAYGWATLSVSVPDGLQPKAPERPTPTPKPEAAESGTEGADGSADNQDPDATAGPMSDDEKEQKAKEDAAATEALNSEESTSNGGSEANQNGDMKKQPGSELPPEVVSTKRLEAAIEFLNQQGQFNIVIVGHGLGAARSTIFISLLTKENNSPMGAGNIKNGVKAAIDRPVRALILIGARNYIEETGENLTNYFTDPGLPILDIYFNDHYLDRHDHKERAIAAKRKNLDKYFQLKLLRPTTKIFEDENRLTRRIRGFLNTHAKGVEITD